MSETSDINPRFELLAPSLRPASLGTHALIDLEGCDRERIDDVAFVEAAMREAALKAGATIVAQVFHRFAPQGVSGVVVIAESHLAVHTWPEFGAVAVDLFTCGTGLRADLAAECLVGAFRASGAQIQTVARAVAARMASEDQAWVPGAGTQPLAP